ncbi:MAG: hypothetical protein WBA93_28585 [Microcoleaceae cyanobacterium]
MRTVSTQKLPLWRLVLNLPTTYLLFIGTAIGYLSLIFNQGLRGIVLLVGSIIALLIAAAWLFRVQQLHSTFNAQASILEAEFFQTELEALERKLADRSSPGWEQIHKWTWKIHHFSQHIASYEPELIPDLLETLYTVLNLFEQSVIARNALSKVHNKSYIILAQNYLKASDKRLHRTHDQLQRLRDQIVLAQLPDTELAVKNNLPKRLQVLINDNKNTLQQSRTNLLE